MHRPILITMIDVKTFAATPTPHKPPHPPPPSPDIFTVLFGSGLTPVLLVLVTLALVGIIASIIWMFMTGRWTTAQSLAAEPSSTTPMIDRSRGPIYTESRILTNQSSMSRSNYSSSPDQTADPSSARNSPLQEGRSTPSLATPSVEDPLNNKRWLGLVKGCVDLYDELDELFPKTDPRQETANHVKYRLQEILSRSGVETIARDRTYDVYRHQLEPPNTRPDPGTPIKKIVSPGFAVGRLVLRPARIQVVTLPIENVENDR